MSSAHDLSNLVFRQGHDVGAYRLNRQPEGLFFGMQTHECAKWKNNKVVGIVAQHSLFLFHDPDHGKSLVDELYFLTYRIGARKQSFGGIGRQHTHVRLESIF